MSGSLRSAACLFAMLAVASCTSADGLMPPAEVGTGLGESAGANTSVSGPALAAAPAAPGAAAAPAALSAAAAPAFSGTEPSDSTQPSVPQGSAPAASAAAAAGTPVTAVAAAGSTIDLGPITGGPQEAVAPLRQRIPARARERGIGVAGSGSLPTHILRGYLSEVADANSTTVIYVWDVVDPAGNRLHRIQGTAKVKGKGGWSAVSAETMQAIADRTIDDLAQWLSSRSG